MKSLKLFFIAFLLLWNCESRAQKKLLQVAGGESFDALTQITAIDKPCYGPNGGDENKNLIFFSLEKGGFYNVYLKDNVMTSAVIQKTFGNNFNQWPSISKDGQRVVFQFFDKTNYDIYYIDVSKGKAMTQVTHTDENEYNPCWSPDGSMIVFEKGAAPKQYATTMSSKKKVKFISITQNQIWIKNLNTGELKMIGIGSWPKFSSDGKQIVYVGYDLGKSKTVETGCIWTMGVDGENPKQLTTPAMGYATQPAWSPDMKYIVFQFTKPKKKDSDIYTIDVNGENLKQHTQNLSQDFSPCWSADGYIYFSSDRGNKIGNFQIWRFKVNP